MSLTLNPYLRGLSRNGFTRPLTHLACATALALLLPIAAMAYTVVLRGGRRVEIPSKFTVTKLALTYEAAPGINITILMASIDIPATERANGEPAGALLKRAEQQATIGTASTRTRTQRRELTKQDIENARREREKSEQEYERRRIELGLPSLAESRRRVEEETTRLGEQARQSRAEEAQAESYWRTRSSQLRTEMAALDAQIYYVRARLSEIPEYQGIGAYGFVTTVAPHFPHRRGGVARFPIVTGHPGFMRGGNATFAQPTAGFLAFGGTTQTRIQLNAGIATRGFGRRGTVAPGIITPFFGAAYPNYDYTGERANLIPRLYELEAARAGLQARFRLLEEEARRAGAQPGWLRQ